MDYVIQEEWHRELIERRTAATDVLDDDHNSRLERERLNEEARLGEILASLDRLIDDEKFIRLPTQKAMLAYAKENIPELAEVDAAELKARIQELNAKIAAKYG